MRPIFVEYFRHRALGCQASADTSHRRRQLTAISVVPGDRAIMLIDGAGRGVGSGRPSGTTTRPANPRRQWRCRHTSPEPTISRRRRWPGSRRVAGGDTYSLMPIIAGTVIDDASRRFISEMRPRPFMLPMKMPDAIILASTTHRGECRASKIWSPPWPCPAAISR